MDSFLKFIFPNEQSVKNMGSCCDCNFNEKRQVLLVVFWINAVMFFVQLLAAWAAHSTSLLADACDMLGDALAYGVSLYAATRGQHWLARAALLKGVIIAFFGFGILSEVFYKVIFTELLPKVEIMLVFSLLGLAANSLCFYLLTRHKDKDINMRSVWICARNDMLVNGSVLLTAGLVYFTHSRWPDILIGVCLAIILLMSAVRMMKEAIKVLNANP